ncbi:MAG: hypothetical protein RBT59_02195 [Arcobacteraceae bacterium]|jgi:hypothetical protein|nr:hypothetical protein [Arcobacteraceae bacterium]
MKKVNILISLVTATLLLGGCGGGGGGTTPTDTTQSAYLIDSAVEGIDYTCGTLTGTTNSEGKFTYDATKCPTGVEFKIGSLSLGTINPSNINTDTYLTIQELAGTTRDNITDENVTKLAVLLQSLDENSNPNDGIVITDTTKGYFGIDENLSSKTDSEVTSLITTAGKTEKDVNDALAHLLSTLSSKGIATTANINPTDFNLTSVTGTALNTPTLSNTITVSGLTIPTFITISNGEYSTDNGTTWKSTKSLVSNGQTVKVRHTTANSLSGTTTTTVKIGGVTKTFGSTTVATLPVFQSGETWKGLVYNTITSSTTAKVWLDRNLGATQTCTALDDTACYGDYYQWGRETDGHEKSNSTTTPTPATDLNTTGNSSFTTNSSDPRDWTTLDSDGALRSANWSKTDGSSVCPVGYRVPTIDELLAETITNNADAYTKLKLPSAGYRNGDSGSLYDQGSWGDIWSSSPYGVYSEFLYFGNSSAGWGNVGRAGGLSVRCVEDFPTFVRGFSTSWLEGKTLYDVYQNNLGGNSWGDIEATTMKFENGKLHIAGGISTDYILVYDYTITGNGIITYYDDVNYFNEPDFVAKHRYIHFNSYNSNGFMEVCYGPDLDGVSSCSADRLNHEVLFLDNTKATDALGNADFFDYIPAP